ncbi:MAG: chitobiase/beta-hexosaminidase C-terminal domain-containing protein [Muribaculaceae bacterium]|nr:chitobiase/beta-hexosaminidase C-terminal domain-containing protein [Muribaculaceae bacterium]
MGKLYSLISALFIAAGSAFAAGPAAYEWWFDNDVSTAQTGSVTGEQFDIQIDATSLPKGAHYFNCRLSTEDGKYGSVYRKMFYNIAQNDGDMGCSYEYWFDNDHDTKVRGELIGGTNTFDIDITALPQGTHYFNCRLNRTDGEWGSVYRKMFYNVSNSTGVVSYEYWIDNNYSGKQTGDITEGSRSFDVSLADVTPGAHYFNCRLYNNVNGWGATYRKMVFTTGTAYDAVAYEYWIDDNYDDRTEGSVGSGENTYEINLTGVRKGLHRFNYRLRNGAGLWGSVYSKYFYYASAKTPFTNYEYWLDDDYANRVVTTTDSNPVTFDIDLSGFDKSGGAHYFNLRVRDDDGEWSSFYRKAIVFYDGDTKAPIIGYRHYINGTDLGYVEVARQITDSYTFAVELPESFRLSVRDKQPVFEGDRVTIAGNDSVQYLMQVRTETGWAPPTTWDLELSGNFTDTAVEMAVNSKHTFTTPATGEFAAVKFTAAGAPLYFRTDAAIALDLYREGAKVAEITAAELAGMKQLQLEVGEYFGILRDAEGEAPAQFTFHLMDAPNAVPTPVIEFENGVVTISCSRKDAKIYYTLNGDIPTDQSIPYSEPFALDHNAVVKAIGIVSDSDLNPSEIAVKEINFYKVADPVITFENLTIVITQEQREGVTTRYTLDGSEPTESSQLYEGPFSLTGNTTVLARSFKEGYDPSEIVTFTYNHATYVVSAPKINLDGKTVTLTTTTEGSTLFYSIDKPDPKDMQQYTAPFLMENNGTVYAQARKDGMYDSEVVSISVTGRQMPQPQISRLDNDMIQIQCAREDAVIYYTTDNKEPNPDSTPYTGEFEFDRNGVIKAIAVDPNGNLDNSAIAELVIDDKKVDEPELSFEHLKLVITQDSREGVSTYYTLDGSEPTEEGNLYNGAFPLTEDVTVHARSFKEGYHPSEIVSFAYRHAAYTVSAPKINLDGKTVTLTATTEGSTLFYSIDKSAPEDMQPYTAPFLMENNGTVYAQARKDDMYDSEVVSVTIDYLTMPKPQIIPVENNMIRISCPYSDAEIRYTTDTTDPSKDSNLYEGEFEFDRNGVIKAIAIDPTGNLVNSEISELMIDDKKVNEPELSFEHLKLVITQDSREGVTTYYTLDGSEPTEEGNLYNGAFPLTEDVTVHARSFKEGYHPSEIIAFSYIHADYVTPAPKINIDLEQMAVTIEAEGSDIYYAIGNDNPEAMTRYEAPIPIYGNMTVYAQARRTDMYDSEVVRQEVEGLTTEIPYGSFDPETRLLTLYCDTEEAEISYTFDTDNEWIAYEGPIAIKVNCTVYAKAVAPNHLESEVAEITVSEIRCDDVTIGYNGRYLTLATEEAGAEIYYTLDGSNPTDGVLYTGEFDAGGLGTVRAVALKDGIIDSDIAEYIINGYADEEHAETAVAGILESCYDWTDREMLDNMESLNITGLLNHDDYALIRSMKSLRHLDLTDIDDADLPDGALADMNLISVTMPEKLTGYGNGILSGNDMLCAIIWNSTDLKADTRLSEGVANPNLLLYLPGRMSGDTGVENTVEGTRAASIVLTDGYPFYAPIEFIAGDIRYTRHFSKETVFGVPAGWETLALPFDVEEIRDAYSVIKPFAIADNGDRPFWLLSPAANDWEEAPQIRAYEPYLISMPNNPEYRDDYNISGDVTFTARNANVSATPEPESVSCIKGTEMWTTFIGTTVDDNVLAINDDWYESSNPGSIFVRNLRDVRPFECYLTADDSRRYIPIFDSSRIEEITGKTGLRIWVENHEICIFSGRQRSIPIYDSRGLLIRTVEIKAGELVRVSDLVPDIYLVGYTKVMVH